MVHDVGLEFFHAERDGGQGVADEVDPQELDGDEGGELPDAHRKEDDDDFGDVGPEEEAHDLLDVGVDAAAFLDGVDDGREVVVGERHVGSALRNVGARDAHRAADVGGFQCGRVVDAVARHRDDLALLLPCLDDADLVFGRNARIDGDMFDFLIELFVAHGVEFCARDGSVAFEQDPQLPCDGGGGDDVVARDHDGLDARLAADGDGFLCLGARGVDHADEPEEGEPVFEFFARGFFGDGIEFLIADGEHAQGVRTHGVVD